MPRIATCGVLSSEQVSGIYSFFDYDKKIHTLEESTLMTQILEKNQVIGNNLKLEYDKSTGFYFI